MAGEFFLAAQRQCDFGGNLSPWPGSGAFLSNAEYVKSLFLEETFLFEFLRQERGRAKGSSEPLVS